MVKKVRQSPDDTQRVARLVADAAHEMHDELGYQGPRVDSRFAVALERQGAYDQAGLLYAVAIKAMRALEDPDTPPSQLQQHVRLVERACAGLTGHTPEMLAKIEILELVQLAAIRLGQGADRANELEDLLDDFARRAPSYAARLTREAAERAIDAWMAGDRKWPVIAEVLESAGFGPQKAHVVRRFWQRINS